MYTRSSCNVWSLIVVNVVKSTVTAVTAKLKAGILCDRSIELPFE